MNLKSLVSYPTGKIAFFELLSEFDNNWQKNSTPISIVRKMACKTNLEDKKVLILFNIEFLQVLIEEENLKVENICFVADSELEYLTATNLFKVKSLLLTDHDSKSLKDLIENNKMKFDVVFSNPPYNANVDIKIVSAVMDFAEEMIVVHPSTWLIDQKNKTKLFVDFKNKLNRKVKSIEFFNGNYVFDIGLFVPCIITHIKQSLNSDIEIDFFNDQYKVDDIYNVTKFGSNWKSIVEPFSNQMKNYISQHDGNVWEKRIEFDSFQNDDSKYYVQLAAIIGHTSKNEHTLTKNDFYTMVMKDSDRNKGVRNQNVRKDGFIVFEFDTDIEQTNFINYLKTDFARFCLAIYKNTQNNHYGEMDLIPWLDFNEEWDDAKLFDKFDISKELQAYIIDFLPDYFDIRS